MLKILFIPFFIISCSTQNLIKAIKESSRDKNVIFEKPKSTYTSLENKDLDALWANSSEGTTLSFVTRCLPLSAPLNVIENIALLSSTAKEYKNDLKEEGSLDHIPHSNKRFLFVKEETQNEAGGVLETVIIKKKSCYYIINFVARDFEGYENENHVMDEFIKNFQV